MAKLYYLQASPRERSKSTRVAKAFVDSYRKSYPNDEIITIDLFKTELPTFDGFAIQAKYSIMHGKEHSPEERQAWKAVEKLIGEFKAADKYLLSVPMWNFSIPYRLKQYIDNLVQPGYTFKVSEKGYEGLVKGKPLAVIYARGGVYSQGSGGEALDFQKKYIDLIFGFIGFENIQSVVAEPTLQGSPEENEKTVNAAVEAARKLAQTF
jgi:FMN-dependent NADH-azoreductase